MNKYTIPNPKNEFGKYTMIPNWFIDKLMPLMSPHGFVVLVYICRKLYGFHKESDRISRAQIEQETGISHSTISKTIQILLKHKILIEVNPAVRQAKKARELSFNYDVDILL